MNQNLIEQIYDVPNIETTWQMVATKGNHKRIYQFKKYEVMQKTYAYLAEHGWAIKITMN